MATRGKITELYDIEKIQAQQTEVIGYVEEFVRKVSNTKPIRVQLEGAEKPKETIKWVTQLGAATQENVKIVNQATVAQAKYNALQTEAAQELAKSKVQIQQRNKELTIEAQLQNAGANSLNFANAMVKKLTAERNNLNLATEEGKKRQAELNDELDQYNKFITENSDKQEKQRRNIGNYGSALKTLEGYLADVRQQLAATNQAAAGFSITAPGPGVRAANNTPLRASDNKQQLVAYNQTVAQTSQRVQELSKQEQLLSRIVDSQIAGFASATAELKSNEKALQALAAAGLQNTEFYQVLLKDTASLKDSVGDLKDEIKALASDTRQFDLVASAVTGLVNVFQVGASAAEIFAGENDEIQKSIQRLVALQNISQGIQQIANDLTARGTALNKVYNFIIGEGAKTRAASTAATVTNTVATEANAAATEVATVATTGLTTATKVLRAALIASGVGLLVAGIIYLISKIQEWRDADINLIKRQAELNQVLLETLRLNKEIADLTRTDIGTDIQALKNKIAANQAYGKSQGEVLAAEKALLKVQQEAATIKFIDTGGAGRADRLKEELEAAGKAYSDFIEQQAKLDPSDRNEKTAAAQKDLLQSNLDLAKENYSAQRKIVDDYYNFNNEVIAKQLQIERLAADERRKYALESATISANTIIDANQRALNNEAATLKQRIALMQSTAEQQKRIARAQNEDVQNDPGASANEKLLAARNLAYQLRRIEQDTLEDQRKLREEYRKREVAAVHEVFKILLEDQIKANDLIAENEKKSLNQRTDALYQSYVKRRQLITANYEFELRLAIKNGAIAEERIALEEKALSEINQLTIEYGLQQLLIYEQNQDKINEIIAKGQQARRDLISRDLAKANIDLIKQLISGQITLEQFTRDREIAERNARIEALKEEINNATAKVLATKEGTAERYAAEKELKEKTQALNEEYYQKEIEGIVKLNELKKELATEAVLTFNSLVNSQFDNEALRIQKAIGDLERQKEKEIEVAQASIANKEERELAITEIEKKAQAERERLEQRQRQVELDRARFEKASNIAQIISTTALAIIKTFKDYAGPQAFPIAAAIGAIGALQLARAIAAPLPKFATGTDDAPGGHVEVGDGGKSELVIEPSGRAYKTPATSTIMNIPKHSVILPDADAVMRDLELMAMNNISKALSVPVSERIYGMDMTKELSSKLDHLTHVVANKKELHIQPGFNSIMAMHKYGSRWNKYINEQTNF